MQILLRYHRLRFAAVLLIGALLLYLAAHSLTAKCPKTSDNYDGPVPLLQDNRPIPVADRNSPLIFIGGVPRSGTTLMRAMLDAHPLIRCGEETNIIPKILGMRAKLKINRREIRRLEEAGVTTQVINAAISAFIVEIIAGHGAPAHRLCNKDPFTLKSTKYLAEIFPNSKYVLMIRDGRATVHSIISRRVTIEGFDSSNHRNCLEMWNQAIENMYDQCHSVGSERCFMMHYEELVLHPEKQMRELLTFLDIPWNSAVLNHELFVGEGMEISLSAMEPSTGQVVKPINLDALNRWVGQFPEDVVREMAEIAPMLSKLGYDPEANPPVYGKPDDLVVRKTSDVHENGVMWYKKAAKLVANPIRLDRPFNESGDST